MLRHVSGRLERDGFHLGEEVEAIIERARVSFPFTRGEAWIDERHRLTTGDNHILEFVVDRKRPYPPDPAGDEEMVEGRLVADFQP